MLENPSVTLRLRNGDRVMIARLKRVSGEVKVSGEGHGIGYRPLIAYDCLIQPRTLVLH